MVCLGNICRSPMAEGILKDLVKKKGLNWVVESAGTNGYHTGEPPHPLSIKVAAEHGIDISHQRAQDFVPSDFEKFDKIYAMASDVVDEIRYISGKKFNPVKLDLLMNVIEPGKNRNIPDPWSRPQAEYEKVFDMMERACKKLVATSPPAPLQRRGETL